MKEETLHPQVSGDPFWSRQVQPAAAIPSLLVWALLFGLALLWYVGLAINAISGRLVATGDWRFTYLLVMLLLVIVCSGATARTQWLAYQGHSLLWWHACSFALGIVFLSLIGIVGD